MLTCSAVEYCFSQVIFATSAVHRYYNTITYRVDDTMRQRHLDASMESGCPVKQSPDFCLRPTAKPEIVKAHPFCSAVGLAPEIAIVPAQA